MIEQMKAKEQKMNSAKDSKLPTKWIIWGTFFIALYFNSKLMDPFNSPKFWILIFIVTWILGYLINDLITSRKNSKNKIPKPLSVYIFFFILFLLLASITTQDKYVAFFGENLRRNGFLTYMSLVVLFVASIKYVSTEVVKDFLKMSVLLSTLLVVYAYFQSTGRDFVDWNNPYNSVILTVGNPNFSAAILAILFLLVLTKLMITKKNSVSFYLNLLLLVSLTFAINSTASRQGLVSLVIGIAFLISVYSFNYSRRFGVSATLFVSISMVVATLGMLQIGPLSSLLYKPSVTVRGYYWRAALEMFYDKPYFGVGVDSFGSFFKEFRDVGYPLKYGFGITSTNAHNVPLQYFATSGFVVGVSYLMIFLYILIFAIRSIRKFSGEHRKLIIGLLATWITYHAQSFISIDNIGLAIWGWVLGGFIVGLCRLQPQVEVTKLKKNPSNINLRQFFLSFSFGFIALFCIANLYRNESNMLKQQILANNVTSNESNRLEFIKLTENTLAGRFLEPRFRVLTAFNYLDTNEVARAIPLLKQESKRDPRNLDIINFLAYYHTQNEQYQQAIIYRKEIVKLDKYNASNYLELGRLYKLLGDYPKMLEVKEEILAISPLIEEAELALAELVV